MSTKSIRDQILSQLSEIEETNAVRILYACESGSRAWGFASTDSDYDVRFFYIHPKDWYLSLDLEQQRDVIELPIENDLDITGWDVRKTLQLFGKSNPPLYEKLFSSIVYLEHGWFAKRLRVLSEDFYNTKSATYHYFNMARDNWRTHLQGEMVNRKKYLYALRPVLAVMWIERDLGVVPIEFMKLVEELVEDPELKSEIESLVEKKRLGSELDCSPQFPAIQSFLARELERQAESAKDYSLPKGDTQTLNQFFKELLNEYKRQ